jgi:hypothetical protein
MSTFSNEGFDVKLNPGIEHPTCSPEPKVYIEWTPYIIDTDEYDAWWSWHRNLRAQQLKEEQNTQTLEDLGHPKAKKRYGW